MGQRGRQRGQGSRAWGSDPNDYAGVSGVLVWGSSCARARSTARRLRRKAPVAADISRPSSEALSETMHGRCAIKFSATHIMRGGTICSMNASLHADRIERAGLAASFSCSRFPSSTSVIMRGLGSSHANLSLIPGDDDWRCDREANARIG